MAKTMRVWAWSLVLDSSMINNLVVGWMQYEIGQPEDER
jgi:hypothetical protein